MEFIKLGQAAKILNTNPDYVWTLAKAGKIPAYKIGVLKNGKAKWGYIESEIQALNDKMVQKRMLRKSEKKRIKLDSIFKKIKILESRIEEINREV
jgi:hypothetical protein